MDTNTIRTSLDLKKTLLHYLFWRLHYPVVIDEYQFMDIFGVRKSEYSVEFEIKVDKQDLIREVKFLTSDQPIQWSKEWSKWFKHAMYLKRPIDESKYSDYHKRLRELLGENYEGGQVLIPNEFYFYIPDYLTELAVKLTQNYPYGVIQMGKTKNSYGREYYSDYEVVKKAAKLHPNKVSTSLYRSLSHGLSVRNRLLRDENYV